MVNLNWESIYLLQCFLLPFLNPNSQVFFLGTLAYLLLDGIYLSVWLSDRKLRISANLNHSHVVFPVIMMHFLLLLFLFLLLLLYDNFLHFFNLLDLLHFLLIFYNLQPGESG